MFLIITVITWFGWNQRPRVIDTSTASEVLEFLTQII